MDCFHRICTKVSTAVNFIVNLHITVLILYANYFRNCIQASLDFRCLWYFGYSSRDVSQSNGLHPRFSLDMWNSCQPKAMCTYCIGYYLHIFQEWTFLRFYLNLARKTRIFSALLIRGSLGNVKLGNSWGYSCSMRLYMNIKFNEQYPKSD